MQCAGEFPLLKGLKERFGDKGLALVGVSVDTVCERARATIDRHGLTWPQICEGKALKGEMTRLFNVDTTPVYYVMDREGVIVGKKVQGEELQGIVEAALAELAKSSGR